MGENRRGFLPLASLPCVDRLPADAAVGPRKLSLELLDSTSPCCCNHASL